MWFILDGASQQLRVDGLQLIGCSTTTCEQPVLLLQHGDCDLPRCLPGPPELAKPDASLVCSDELCLASAASFGPRSHFWIVAQIAGQAYASDVREMPGPQWLPFWEEVGWQVSTSDGALSVTSDPAFESPRIRRGLLVAFALTQSVELIVAGLYLWVRRRSTLEHAMGRLLMVFLINLVTLPVVWFSFPALGWLQSPSARGLGVAVLALAAAYATALVFIYASEEGRRRRWIVWTLIATPLLFGCVFYAGIEAIRIDPRVAAGGVSASVFVIAAEVFAVVCEAILLHLLSRKALPLQAAGLLSLLMNVASYLLGILAM
jgi:hypothetical protein